VIRAAAILMCWALVAQAAPPADLSGEWYFDVSSPNGPGHREVLFRQEGERVIGFIESDSASGRFVGSYRGAALEFTAVLEFGGQPMAAVYRASVDGEEMSGTIDFGLYGKATFTGHRGRRPANAAAPAAGVEGSARDAGIAAAVAGDLFGVVKDGALLPEIVEIPAGRFRMGNDGPVVKPEYGEDYARVHEVEVSAFRMGRFLVTNAQYAAFASATKREPALAPKGWTDYATHYPNHPVVSVNYEDAVAYSRWLSGRTGASYRLPTEAEWEYAALGGAGPRNYVFGDAWQEKGANTATFHIGRLVTRDEWKSWWDAEGARLSKSRPMTTRVGSFAPNGYGLYDMVGNAWQWTDDWYQADYYAHSPVKDPKGPASGDEKVLRGCSWYNQPDVCLIATRDRYAPGQRLYYNGFRVVASD
jgi:formylglycine-generating enzyme required for sulfatase activity